MVGKVALVLVGRVRAVALRRARMVESSSCIFAVRELTFSVFTLRCDGFLDTGLILLSR